MPTPENDNKPSAAPANGNGQPAKRGAGKGQPPQKPGDRAGPLSRPDTGRALNASALVSAVRRRWLLGGTLGLMAAAVAAAVVWTIVPAPRATARAMVHIAAKPEGGLPGRVQDPNDFANFQRTQLTVVKSQLVLNAALRNPHVLALEIVHEQAAPMEWLMQELEVDFSMGPEVLKIAMKGEDGDALKVLVNAVMHAYLTEFINHQEVKRAERLEQLKTLRTKHEKVVHDKRAIVEAFTPKLGTGDPKVLAVWHDIKLKTLTGAKTDMLGVQSERNRLELELKGLEKSEELIKSNYAISEVALEELLQTDMLYVKQLEQVALIEEEILIVQQKAANPEQAKAVLERKGKFAELDLAQKVVERRRQELLPKFAQRLRDKARIELEVNIQRARRDLFLNGERHKLLSKVITDLAAEAEAVGKESFELLLARADLEEEEKIVRQLVAEIRSLGAELMSPPRAQPLDDAVVVRANGERRRLFYTAGAGMAALVIVLLAVGWWEWHSRRIHSAEDVAHGLGIRLVGTLPPLPRRFQNRLCEMGASDTLPSYCSESIDTFRTFLLHDAAAHEIRSVMVTSAVAGEGKTTLACQLAISLARAGRKTLLIDSDLRRSSVHRRLGLAQAPGLAEVLRGEKSLPEVIQTTSVEGLSVVCAGKGDSRAVQKISQRIHDILEEAKSDFAFVLVDSAPVLSVAEPLLIGQHVDGVILSTLRGLSRIPLAAAAQHRIAALGIPSLGAVVSGTREELYSFGYQPTT
jgi:succinoglycan biosynthesis transport protein ExoP